MLMALGGLLLASGAQARDRVTITSPPSIPEIAAVGQTLTATGATWASDKPPLVTYRWVRCAEAKSFDCEPTGQTGTSYTVTGDDLGQRLFVWLHVQNGDDGDDAFSERTEPVAEAPAPPIPSPTPSPAPPSPAPGGDLVPPDTSAPPPASGGVAGRHAISLRRLSPFPIVRIKGYLTRGGARVTMLTVRAPRGAGIDARCPGPGCPRKGYARATTLAHLRPSQRLLRGSLELVISVTRRGFVGKQTTLRLRRGKPPTRRDLCLLPGVRKAK